MAGRCSPAAAAAEALASNAISAVESAGACVVMLSLRWGWANPSLEPGEPFVGLELARVGADVNAGVGVPREGCLADGFHRLGRLMCLGERGSPVGPLGEGTSRVLGTRRK